MEWILLAVFWLACAYLAFGFAFGYCQGRWPEIAAQGRLRDMKFSAVFCLGGPISLIVLVIVLFMLDGAGLSKYGRLYPWQSTKGKQ